MKGAETRTTHFEGLKGLKKKSEKVRSIGKISSCVQSSRIAIGILVL